MIGYKLEERSDSTGTNVTTIIKTEDGKPDDEICSVQELDRLIETCSRRWGHNWNLEKLIVVIQESDID